MERFLKKKEAGDPCIKRLMLEKSTGNPCKKWPGKFLTQVAVKCVTLTKEAVGGCRKRRGKKTAGNKKKCREPCEKNSFCGNKKTCRKPCKNEAKENPVIKDTSGNYVEKRGRWNKKTGGAPCKRNS